MSKALVFFSGGMDSLICAEWAKQHFGDDVQALYINFGHRYAEKEMQAAKSLAFWMNIPLVIKELPLGEFEKEDAFIPLRNLFLLELGALYADNLIFGMLYHERSLDKRPGFIRTMQRLLASQFVANQHQEKSRQLQIHTPFSGCTKTEALRWYLKHTTRTKAEAIQAIYGTVGCYSFGDACGCCASCFNRWVALTLNGLCEHYETLPYVHVAKTWLEGSSKPGTFSPSVVWYKAKYALEVYLAMRRTLGRPLTLAKELYFSRDVSLVEEAARNWHRI